MQHFFWVFHFFTTQIFICVKVYSYKIVLLSFHTELILHAAFVNLKHFFFVLCIFRMFSMIHFYCYFYKVNIILPEPRLYLFYENPFLFCYSATHLWNTYHPILKIQAVLLPITTKCFSNCLMSSTCLHV